jgi:raffinose/stachyose/melibiose transport system substrate-binding protein
MTGPPRPSRGCASTEITVELSNLSRRSFLSLTAGTSAAAALAACGSSGPGTSSGGGAAKDAATFWFLTGQPQEGIRADAVAAFNKANPDNQIKENRFQNDAFKTKIKAAIGAGQGPTLIWGWGGGGLKSYVDAGQVEDLTDWMAQNAAIKDKLFPSSFPAATVNGKLYALPIETVQPIVLYWNKKVFDSAGVQPPQSWGDIMNLVGVFNSKGIAPFSLGGQSRWTNMMWLEFLYDRIGGPEVFQAIYAGEKDAWNHPASIEALTKVQQLVNAKGFIKGFSSITADSNADQALLYKGRAAMMLHGGWTYGGMKKDGGDFVKKGELGWMNFPPVENGKGDPSDTVGNPGQYLSISSKATAAQKETAKKFLATGKFTDAEIKGWIDSGAVPIVKGTESLIAASPDAAFLKFVYDLSSKAKFFGQSWDQALSPAASEVLLSNISKLFQTSITPQQFASNMNAVLGK